MTVHANDDINDLFDTASKEAAALDALDGAVNLLKSAREAKACVARLDAPQLREGLLRRSGRHAGERT